MRLQQDLLTTPIQVSGAPCALEELETKLRFEPLHLSADCRLGQVDLDASSGKCAFSRYGNKGFQLAYH
ncbi:hypothetical protein D3C79_849830 [compost metagenome]